jgi:diguanylate cyclase (GGDEF)-like protein
MLPDGPTASAAPAAASPDAERGEMGRLSGWMWAVAGIVGIVGALMPGASHQGLGWIVLLSGMAIAYGLGSVTGAIPWHRASLGALAIGMAVTVPVVGPALYLSGGSVSYIEPLLVCSLLYGAFFFPARWAWPLTIELVLVAGTPLLYDPDAVGEAFVPRFLGLATAFFVVTWVMLRLKRRLVEAEEYQRRMATLDALTGVGNRRAFDLALGGALAARTDEAGRRGGSPQPLAVVLFDLDRFKAINDEHGHAVGDMVLRRVAQAVGGSIRRGDTLARIGGDEFAVVAPGAGAGVARNLAKAVEEAVGGIVPARGPAAVGASVGWSTCPDDGEDRESLLHAADLRLLNLKARERKAVQLQIVAAEDDASAHA